MVLEPGHGLGVEVVGGLVEQQQIRPLEQQRAEGDATLLTAAERGDVCVAGRQAQGVHGQLQLTLEVPAVAGVNAVLKLSLLLEEIVELVVLHRLAELHAQRLELLEQLHRRGDADPHVAHDVEIGVELGLLGQEADGVAIGQPGLTAELGLLSGHDPEQGRLASAVAADHADLRARIEREVHRLEDLFAVGGHLRQVTHVIDELLGHAFLLPVQGTMYQNSGSEARSAARAAPRGAAGRPRHTRWPGPAGRGRSRGQSR